MARGDTACPLRSFYSQACFVLLVVLFSPAALADANIFGQTGLINMPDGRVEEDGTLRFGLSQFDPYTTAWSSITFLSRLELTGRYTEIDGVPGFEDNPEFGDYKDKAFDAKLLLLRESRWAPSLAIGTQDFTGTRLFSSDYIALSKRFRDLDLTLGWGQERIDGVFGGLRYRLPWNRKFSLLAEYDAIDYQNDFRASESGADQRKGGATYGLAYTTKWGGVQLSYQGGDVGLNAYASIPLTEKRFVPWFDEPAPFTKRTDRPALEKWQRNPRYARRLARALTQQGFNDVELRLEDRTLAVSLSHSRISFISRAVGRTARTLLLLGPMGMDSIQVTYTLSRVPVVTYYFKDAYALQYYFDGLMSLTHLQKSIDITFATPEYAKVLADAAIRDLAVRESTDPFIEPQLGRPLLFGAKRGPLSRIFFAPFNLNIFFNDPTGAFRFDLFSVLGYSTPVARRLFFNSAVRFTLAEDVTEVEQASNSLLPHVRSDVALYKQGPDLRLLELLLNKYYLFGERLYGRLSAGYYEEMFAGAGGQILYLPRWGKWAVDLSVDWVKQRDPDDAFGFIDYSVLTALAGFHYRFPKFGITTTVRAGRFLAKDDGVRFEVKRRFRSGVEVGGWFTVTDIDDITSPGSPDDPYRDKGIFLSVPFNIVLGRDSRATANFSLSPWTRDVGQMVDSPGDLYRLMERSLMLDNPEYGPLVDLDK